VLPDPDLRLELEHRTPRSRAARVHGPADLERAIADASVDAGIAVSAGSVGVERS
jgi:hypothetical protein